MGEDPPLYIPSPLMTMFLENLKSSHSALSDYVIPTISGNIYVTLPRYNFCRTKFRHAEIYVHLLRGCEVPVWVSHVFFSDCFVQVLTSTYPS